MHITHLAETMIPFELNSIAVNAAGELTRVNPRERPFGFSFECLGLRFSAAARQRSGRTWLQMAAQVGPLPYTAESLERRQSGMTILRACQGLPRGRIAVSRDGQIQVSGEIPLDSRLTAVNVVSAAAELVLEVKPYLSLLGDFVLTGFGGAQPGKRLA